jgi:hypothetical protein
MAGELVVNERRYVYTYVKSITRLIAKGDKAMKLRNVVRTLILATFGASLFGPPVLAQHAGHGGGTMPSPTMPAVRSGKVKGTIIEFTSTSVTVEKEKSKQTERIVCLIDGQTKVKGKLAVGAQVVVKYREQENANIATTVEVKKPK